MELTFVCRPTHAWFLCKPAWWFSGSSSWLPSSGFSPSHASTPGSMTARRKSSSASQLQILGEKKTLISQKKLLLDEKYISPPFQNLIWLRLFPPVPACPRGLPKTKFNQQLIKWSKSPRTTFLQMHFMMISISLFCKKVEEQIVQVIKNQNHFWAVELNENFHQAK